MVRITPVGGLVVPDGSVHRRRGLDELQTREQAAIAAKRLETGASHASTGFRKASTLLMTNSFVRRIQFSNTGEAPALTDVLRRLRARPLSRTGARDAAH